MNLFQRTALVAVVTLGMAGRVRAAEGIAFVHMEKLFQSYWRTARSDSSFSKQKDLYKDHAKNLRSELEALKQQADQEQEKALNIALSDEARGAHRKEAEEKNALFLEKRKELKEFLVRTDKELQKKYLELRAEIVKEISAFLKSYGKEQGYDMLLDISGLTRNYIPVVVYSPEEKDITETVLVELNRGHEDEVREAKEKKADDAKKPAPGKAGDAEAEK